ncbi:phosphonate C-P lyase system protein PhnH [Oleispirillum naphthae]|uniref:phosphonate C-P lyase system protein PhnH n=1 Tax=Oleispirillum naphthae TaxID=2838853 RepID=UPI0030824502
MMPFPSPTAALAPHLPSPGFADPVRDAQRCFRKVLAAISYPGRLQDMRGLLSIAPGPLHPAAAALCLALFDLDTPVWLGRSVDTPDVRQFLSFHCGCPVAAQPGEAAFAVLSAEEATALMEAFHVGTPEYPDRAATLLIQTSALAGGPAAEIAGPGIPGSQAIEAAGLTPEFWARRGAINALFPTGLDMILIDAQRIAGLPRTVRIER